MTSPSRSDMSELIDEAIAALEPFAACAPSKRDADFYAWGSRMDGLTWGDFRRADSTLSRLKEASGGGEGTGLGTSQDHAPASGSALDWRPIESAPKDGRPFCVRALTTYRWSFYKPDGRRQMRKPGRWQVAGEYGGWDNAELPEGAEWSPYITPVQSGADGEAGSTGTNKTPIPPDKDGQSLTVEEVADKDIAWLERQIDGGHCGESTSEAVQRQRTNGCVRRILSKLRSGVQPLGGGDE